MRKTPRKLTETLFLPRFRLVVISSGLCLALTIFVVAISPVAGQPPAARTRDLPPSSRGEIPEVIDVPLTGGAIRPAGTDESPAPAPLVNGVSSAGPAVGSLSSPDTAARSPSSAGQSAAAGVTSSSPSTRIGLELSGMTGGPIDTFWYGGTVLVGGVPVAAEPGASGWVNRRMWTWSPVGLGGIPHSGLNMDGWQGVDNTDAAPEFPFRRVRRDSIGACALNGDWEMFCGLTSHEAWMLCFADTAGTGYGNDWNKHVASPTLAYSGSGPVIVEFNYRIDVGSEIDYDFAFVTLDVYDEISSGTPPDSGWVFATTRGAPVRTYSGVSGAARDSFDVSSVLSPYGHIKYRFRIYFAGDGGWSDEDGLNPSACGGFGFDDVSVMGAGVSYANDFETNTDWAPVVPPDPATQVGDFARTEWMDGLSPAVSEDPCVAVPGSCDLADSVIVLFDPTPEWYPHPECQNNHFQSPSIWLGSHPNHNGIVLHFEYFAKTRACGWGTGDGFIPYWGVRYWPGPDGQCWSDWTIEYRLTQDNYNTGGLPSCGKTQVDASALVTAAAESVQVRLGGLNDGCHCWDCCDENNNTPYFDNVCVGVYGNDAAPILTMSEHWRWQDQFPKNGALSSTSPADTRTGLPLISNDPSVFGDTLICYSGSENTKVTFVFRMPQLGPDIDTNHPFFTNLFPGVIDVGGNPTNEWQYVRMDTAEATGVGGLPQPSPGYWMAAFHEEDVRRMANGLGEGVEILPNGLFTPGTRVEYFLKARYIGGGAEFLLPDTTGGNFLEFEVLPMMERVAGELRWPCLVVASHSLDRSEDGKYSIEIVKEALTSAGFTFDEYDRLLSLSTSGAGIGRPVSLGLHRGPGATVPQLSAYRAVIVCGGSYKYPLNSSDVTVIDGWLANSDSLRPRFVWVNGDNVIKRLTASWGSAFLQNKLCASGVSESYFATSADMTYCLPLDGWSGGRIACAALGGPENEHLVLAGNRCPRAFDIGGVSGAAGCSGAKELAFNESRNGETYAPSISGIVEQSGGPWFKSLIEGYDLAAVKNDASLGPPKCGPDLGSANALASWVECVLHDFGGVEHISYCDQSWCVGVEDPGVGAPAPSVVITRLEQSYPNPMNPTAVIKFSVAKPGNVALRIYDTAGRVIRTLFDETIVAPGTFEIAWDGRSDDGGKVASGVFFYQLETGNFRSAKKILILR